MTPDSDASKLPMWSRPRLVQLSSAADSAGGQSISVTEDGHLSSGGQFDSDTETNYQGVS